MHATSTSSSSSSSLSVCAMVSLLACSLASHPAAAAAVPGAVGSKRVEFVARAAERIFATACVCKREEEGGEREAVCSSRTREGFLHTQRGGERERERERYYYELGRCGSVGRGECTHPFPRMPRGLRRERERERDVVWCGVCCCFYLLRVRASERFFASRASRHTRTY